MFVGLWLAVGALRKEYKHTAIFVSAAILLRYSFAAVQEAAAKGGLDNVQAGNKIVLGIVALVVVAVVLYIKFRKYVDEVTYLLNVIGIFLLITPVVMGVFQYFRGATAANLLPDRKPLFASDAALTLPEQPPDIYYLLLDGYGRGDFLAEEFDFDNSAMLDFLGEQGFYVAERSRANYPMTLVSVASSLNYKYLDKLLGTQFGGFPDRSFARALVRDSRVVKLLRRAGHKIISVESEYYEANIAGADVEMKSWWHLNIVEGTVFGMTPIPSSTRRRSDVSACRPTGSRATRTLLPRLLKWWGFTSVPSTLPSRSSWNSPLAGCPSSLSVPPRRWAKLTASPPRPGSSLLISCGARCPLMWTPG